MFQLDLAKRSTRQLQPTVVERAVDRHARNIWGEEYELTALPCEAPPPLSTFRVICAAAPRAALRCAYLTCGGATAGHDREREFLLMARERSAIHVDTLTNVAAMHAQSRSGIEIADIIDLGRPWFPGAMASCLIATPPHRRAPPVGCFMAGDRTVRVLWLRPISELEARFARTHGLSALLRKLDESTVDFTDAHRPHVV